MIDKLRQLAAIRRASRNIARLYSGDMSDREQAQIGNWRNDSPEYRQRFVDTMQLMSDMEVLASDQDLRALVGYRRRPETTSKIVQAVFQKPGLAVAAGLMLAVASVFYFWQQPLQQRADIYRYVTRIGEQKTINLSDGSVVTLNTATELLVEITDNARELTLKQGEVYFDVAKDTRPFTVGLGDRAVSALGTEFNIYRSPERFRVAVTEGVVSVHQQIEKADAGAPLLVPEKGEVLLLKSAVQHRLKAGMVAEFDIGKQQLSAYLDKNINRVQSWRTGIVRFDSVPLSAVIQELNRYSAKKILIEDAEIMNLELYATVRINRINMALAVLENALPVQSVQHFDRIVLKRRE